MARALRAWAIKGRKRLGPKLAVRTSHSANKRYKALCNKIFFNVFDTNFAILFVQHVSIDPRYMRREIKYLITNINVYLFIRFEMNVFSL